MLASLSGQPISRATITIPYQGIWHADVEADGVLVSGAVTLTVGSLVLKGTVFRSGFFTGDFHYRIVGGAGGWQKIVPSKVYNSNSSIRLSLVLNDAARVAGETISLDTDRDIGSFYVRQQAPAARVLNQLTASWHVRPDGVTAIGTRSEGMIASPFDVLSRTDLGIGKVSLATDRPEDFTPGKSFKSLTLSTQKIGGVVHRLDRSKLRTEVWIDS
jgi:hypothetical protein